MTLERSPSQNPASWRAKSLQKKTLPEEANLFLIDKQIEECSPKTITTYRERLTRFFSFSGKLAINEIVKPDITRFLLHQKERGLSPAYIHGHFKDLRTFFNWCVAEGYLVESPLKNLKSPKIPKVKRVLITELQRDSLLDLCAPNAFHGARSAAIVWLLWTTGMRKKELAGLNVSDLTWGDKGRIKVYGKGAHERWVPFTKKAQKAMARYIHHRKSNLPELWLTERGKRPATIDAIDSILERLFIRVGIFGKFNQGLFHVFRRAWAVRNLKKGRSLKEIQLIGGWSSMRTLEIYLYDMDVDDALEKEWD